MQTQSLPTWYPGVAKLDKLQHAEEEDPAYLSGEDTDCDSERGSDVLSREDQQLLASFIHLQRERAHKHVFQAQRPAVARTTPMLIPTQSRKYVEETSKNWSWDDDEDDQCDQCPCCARPQERGRSSTRPAEQVAAAPSASDLIFDLEL